MAEPSGEKPRPINKIRNTIAALGITAATVAGVATVDNSINNKPEPSTMQTYPYHEDSRNRIWLQKVDEQLKTGSEIKTTDLIINVENGELYVRYAPTVNNPDNDLAGNLAAVYKKGSRVQIDKAIIVRGQKAGSTDEWALFRLNGKEVYVYLGDLTDEHIIKQKPEQAKLIGSDENGMPIISLGGNIFMLGEPEPMTQSAK